MTAIATHANTPCIVACQAFRDIVSSAMSGLRQCVVDSANVHSLTMFAFGFCYLSI